MSRKAQPASETENNVFAKKLKKAMDAKSITQKALAEHLGFSRQTVGYYLQGQSEPRFDTLVKIANFLDVSTDYLLTDTDIRTNEPTLAAAQQYTGLSEKSIKAVREIHYLYGLDELFRSRGFIDFAQVFKALRMQVSFINSHFQELTFGDLDSFLDAENAYKALEFDYFQMTKCIRRIVDDGCDYSNIEEKTRRKIDANDILRGLEEAQITGDDAMRSFFISKRRENNENS